MNASKTFDMFLAKCPFAVLTQAAMRSVIANDLDEIFEENRQQQYEYTLTFSAMAMAVTDVVLRFAKNFHQAYSTHKENLQVSLTSFYNKINATELQISEAVVARSAQRAAELQDQLGFTPWEVLKGYKVYALDGNHLQGSEKRLMPLRDLHDAPLAGTVVGRFDLQRQLFDRAYLLDDAHAQESSTLQRVLDDLEPGDLLMADRHYCILAFLRASMCKGVFFLIRQHGRFKGVLVGKRRKIGRSSTGTVYEQLIKTSSAPDALVMRRITVELDKPTRDGDTEIHLLTNLPDEVDAIAIAEAYRRRWEEETGFYYLTTTMTCELKSVGHPQAALLLFCMAMMAFNVRQTIFAALYAVYTQEEVDAVSHHALSVEVSRYTDGMLVVLDDAYWQRLIGRTAATQAEQLRKLAGHVNLSNYRKRPRGPKIKKSKPPQTRRKNHVSTGKLLKQSTQQTP